MIHRTSPRNRAFVLIVALGVLGVLGLLAATFATLSRVERSVSSSYVDKVRARMLAQSGIERAVANLRGRHLQQNWDDARNDWYYRELLNKASGGLTYTGAALARWAPYAPVREYGSAPRSLEAALESTSANGISYPNTSPGANMQFSGTFSGTYEVDGDLYALKVVDCASMLNVNDGGTQIVRMLDNLGSILKCSDGTPVNFGGFQLGTQLQGRAVLRGKPFNNKSEVLDEGFLNNPWFADKADARKRFDAVKDFITCHGWTDGTTVRFDNTWGAANDYSGGSYSSAMAGGSGSGSGSGGGGGGGSGGGIFDDGDVIEEDSKGGLPGATKAWTEPVLTSSPLFTLNAGMPGQYASLPGTRLLMAPAPPGLTNPKKGGGFKQVVTGKGSTMGDTKWGKVYSSGTNAKYWLEPRTPVNVNTATKEVLVATLMGLEADFWDYEVLDESPASGVMEYTARMTVINVKITKAEAETAADWIITSRFTFGNPTAGAWSFNDWMHFENEVLAMIPGFSRFQVALLKANFNPNSNIRKLCPDLILVSSDPTAKMDRLVRMDKSDIKIGSTDWTFSSNGFYEIESIGRVMNSGRVMSEEKVETVVKLWDTLRFSNQEQFEEDREWNAKSTTVEGDLLANGYPPIVSMPEYAYNPASSSTRYRSQTGDTTWCADYDGYLVLNGPAKVQAGNNPGPAYSPASPPPFGATSTPQEACYGPDTKPRTKWQDGSPFTPNKACAVSFVAGFNFASLYPAQSHRNTWHATGGGTPRHPAYSYQTYRCHNDGWVMNGPLHSHTGDTGYNSGGGWSQKRPWQIEPTAVGMAGVWGIPTGPAGANFWDNGCDINNFGIYINQVRRNRFHTYWPDEVPAPNCTIEMTVKPEIDLWNWATRSKMHSISGYSGGGMSVYPCSRQFLFEWGSGSQTSGHGMNYRIACYVQLSRVYLEFYHVPTQKYYVMYSPHKWLPHTWHHIEVSFSEGGPIVVGDPPTTITVPPNAMLFVDGTASENVLEGTELNATLGFNVHDAPALVLPQIVHPTTPNNDYGQGPRLEIGSCLAFDGGTAMSQPAWHGLIDNIVMHHWRAHDASFTPRNRYHSVSYYDGSAGYESGMAMGSSAKSGVYKKRIKAVETEALTKQVRLGYLSCTHYHPYHEHLFGHSGGAPITAFGHITPAVIKASGGSYITSYAYDGCVGLKIDSALLPGEEFSYMAMFEVPAFVPVTLSPILCDFSVTYLTEPKTYYRLSSSEARK